MSEYIPKYPSKEGDDSNKTSSELLAETLKPIYVPQELMLAWESHLASYSRDTNVLLDQVKDSEDALNAQYQALLARVQKYEQMLQDITMDSNEFTMDTDEVNFTGWNILAQASYWDYLLKKEITKLSDKIKGIGTRGELVSDITGEILEGLVADNNYISNVIEALSNTPLIQELDAALNSTTSSLSALQAEYVRLAEKQVADAEALANQQVANAEQLAASLEDAIAEQLDRLAEEAAIRTQLLQELEAKTDAMTAEYTAVVDTLHTTVIQELTSLQDGITTSVSELKSADEAIITNLDAYKVSNGENIAALQSSVNVVTNAQESTANQVTGLVASFDQLGIGLSKAQADIITSNQARAAGDEALSQQIITINTGLGNANSRIDTVSDSVSTLDSATATKFSALNAELIDVNTSVASARQIADSAVTANIAQASEINKLNSRMSTTEGNVTKKADATALSNLETKVDNADAALSIRIDSLVANLTAPDGTELNANAFNALRAEVLTNSGNITTHTSQINALNSSLSNVNTGLSANANAVANLTTKVTQQGESITSHSQAIQQLQSDLDVAEAGLATKASTTALNTTNTNVSSLDNRVTANTNSLNSLGSRMNTVEGVVSTKLDASVISNYFTKGQAAAKSAAIAAGKIESYDANLVIGGANLLLNSDFSEAAHWSKWGDNGGGYVKVNDPIYGSVVQTQLPSGLVHSWVKLENNVEYSYSALVKPSNDLYQTPLHYRAGKDNQHQNKIHVLSYSPTLIKAGKWTRINIVFKLVDDADSFRPFIFGSSGVLQIAWTKLERGNKATDWTANDQEVQQSINANANAIQTVTAEVSRINGEVVATANSVSTLRSNVGLLQGSINEVRQTVTNNQESTNTLVTSLKSGMADADDVSMMMRNAAVIFEDLSFKNGWNGVQVYNNYGNGALAGNFTGKLPDNPVASTRQLQFIHSGGATTPGLGGFYQATQSRANGVFLVKFVAKLPVGFSFGLAANAFGDGASYYFIGGSEGTGKFKTYYGVYRCGATGSFSTVGFVYVNGLQPTPKNPLIWYLASSTMYDCLDSKVVPDSVVNGIAEAKSTANTAVNKSEATALIAQNLQASLDNTNANTANAVSSLTTRVSDLNGVVTSQARQIVTLESSKSAIENGAIAGNDEYIVDLRDPAYNRDLYYPVLLSGFSTEYRQTIRVMATLNHASVPPWSSHVGGFSLNAQFQMGGSGWGTINPEVVTDNFSYLWTHWDISPLDQIGQIGESSQPFFYVRGGGYYRLSKPVNRSVQVCAPNSSVSGYYGNTLYPRPYQASTVPKSINQELNQQNVKLQQTNAVIDGVKAISTVTVDNNGVMSGYGLISELKNGRVTSAFGVNADTFYIGAPASNKKPFLVTTYPQTIDGITYPAGTWINSAIIANASIGTAKIADASITNAKIANLDAAKINTGTLSAGRIGSKSITSDHINVNSLSAISANLGTIEVGTTNISDSAVTAAKISSAAITTAKIGDLQVDTLKIKDRAITMPYFYVDTAPVSIINKTFGSFPLVNGTRQIPTISGMSLYNFTPYADVLVMCDVKLEATLRLYSAIGIYSVDSAVIHTANNAKSVPAANRITARLIGGYYDTSYGGETADAQIIGPEATEDMYIDSNDTTRIRIQGTRIDLGGTYTRRLKADSKGRIDISLWVSSYGVTSNNNTLNVQPRGSIVWYAQELKK